MDEDVKYGREIMNKVLGWGSIVYFLVLGFSMNQHALFELNPAKEQIQLEEAKIAYAETSKQKPRNDLQRKTQVNWRRTKRTPHKPD